MNARGQVLLVVLGAIQMVVCAVSQQIGSRSVNQPSGSYALIDGVAADGAGNRAVPDYEDNALLDMMENVSLKGNVTFYPNGTEIEDPKIVPPPTRIPYSVPLLNISYMSQDPFDARGMEYLYLLTNIFLKMVYREQEMPEELSVVVQQEVSGASLDKEQAARVAKKLEANWDVILVHYIGVTLLVAFGLLLAIVMPFAGLVFACCRCGGKCGAGQPCYDKKRDPCRRGCLGTLLALLVVVLLIAMVCPFVSNARVEAGVQTLPMHARTAIEDAKLYINNTHKEMETLNVRNFVELKTVLFNKLDSSGHLINIELARVSKAIAIDNLTAIAASLSNIKKDLYVIKNATLQLQEETSYLQSGLSDVANRLIRLKKACEDVPECLKLISKYANKLEISNRFLKLPSVETKLREVELLIHNEIEIEVKRGKRAFESIAMEIQSKVRNTIPEIKQQITDTGHQLMKASRDVHSSFQKLNFDKTNNYINKAEQYIYDYSSYRYWSFFGLSMVLLLITFCFTMGLFYGCCGRRPDETTSCYKTSGASWLMWGVYLTFLFSAVIMISTTALFLAGTVSEVLFCDPINDPAQSDVFAVFAQEINIAQYYPDGESPDLTEIIRKCHRNESIYSVLHLDSLDTYMDKLANYKDHLKLNEKVDKLKREIGQSIDTDVQILSKEAKQQLRELANSSIAYENSSDFYTNILEHSVLKIDLLDLTARLNQTADDLPPGYSSISVKLKNDAIFLEGLRRWLSSIESNAFTLRETTQRLSVNLKFNKTSLAVAIQDLITQAEFAQRYLRVNGSQQVAELVNRFTVDFLADVDDYVEYVGNKFQNEVGRCGPMSVVYNATASSVCRNILYPFNGFWASIGWCFFCFIPCMFVSVQLAMLYRKTEPYQGPLTESHESMYDAYAERDNIPLTSGSDKKHQRRSRDYDCNYSAEPYVSSSASHRTSFPPNNDWTEYPPSGGPPRYTSQPSLSPEYERPPPYYYPGPGNS